jgi:hypothetical protein
MFGDFLFGSPLTTIATGGGRLDIGHLPAFGMLNCPLF